ncbi:MAG TPA: glutamine synthetase family protein [Actinomycetota bacterium]|jgi:glutamine synthetase|nr:glutamine synthetase family protein [Actinomycetota bacterium]
MERQQDYVLRTVEERGIRLVWLWFTDVLGFLKSFAVTSEELEQAFDEGIGFDGSAIEGFARVQESDMLARPDAATFQIMPGAPDHPEGGVARMFCDIRTPDGRPFWGDPRYVLRRNLERAAERGFTFYLHPEMEFFLFRSSDDPTPIDAGGYFDLTTSDVTSELRRDTINVLEQMGIPVEFSHHEVAPGQHEIDLRHQDALTMADSVMTYRLIVKELAAQRGLYATFMPKPRTDLPGNGMHTHISLFEGDQNAFHDAGDEYHLSKVARAFIGGLLHHAREFTLITNQWVNSYKRLITGEGYPVQEAPTYVCWGRHNRSALIRVPMYKPRKEQSTRVEMRSPDPACNPYLAFSVILAAGLKGIDEGYELPPEATDNIYEMTEQERRARGIERLPDDLNEAIREMERSDLVAEALGEQTFEYLLRNKRAEWDRYKSYVSPYEVERYLPVL